MPSQRHRHHRTDLARIAAQAMREKGLEPEFPPAVVQAVNSLQAPGLADVSGLQDLRHLPWCSIDNDDSLDLDQLSACELLDAGQVRLYVAIADVDVFVGKNSVIDLHAQLNTASIYSSARVFPMLPVRLSNDLSSLNPGQDRCAVVTTMLVDAQGHVLQSSIERAWVRNQAKLCYDAVSDWLLGRGPLPPAIQATPGMQAQVRTQDAVAQAMRLLRRQHGSLEFQTFQPKAVFDGDDVQDIRQEEHNRARQLIEELMIATNTCTARFLARHGGASLRRVVRTPKYWPRIVEVARRFHHVLPAQPDPVALESFLAQRRKADPLRFADLSLVIIKLMGPGEYVVERPHDKAIGHFGLAERDYTHATAPNRRYPDLITQRMVKALLASAPAPYSTGELDSLARHCTQQEDAARKVERRVRKSEAALVLETRIGQEFDAVVTGSTPSGTWVRIFLPPVEGMLVGNPPDLPVGQLARVKLKSADVERGFIDFVLLHLRHGG